LNQALAVARANTTSIGAPECGPGLDLEFGAGAATRPLVLGNGFLKGIGDFLLASPIRA
jgi:hypothetical protein